MKQLDLRISLTAAVASLATSFPSVASVHSDGADGIEFSFQEAVETTWPLLISAHVPACLLSASEPGIDVLTVIAVPGTATETEGAVHPPYQKVALGSQQPRDLQRDSLRHREAYTDLWERI